MFSRVVVFDLSVVSEVFMGTSLEGEHVLSDAVSLHPTGDTALLRCTELLKIT